MDATPGATGVEVEGRYAIERELGRGGMATVYLARDLRHGRPVALKVLDADVAGIVGSDRFLQEVRLMATLQHPHIVPVFDSGTLDGLPCYVMPYVTGETLRQRLQRVGRLGVDEAVAIIREVGAALDFAHRSGIVHRDIKPENILLSDGHALVADFGIARAVAHDDATRRRLTATGFVLGTPGYMSPEQAAGDHVVDARTDVYALGAVAHEMLAGTPPFVAHSAQALLARVLTEAPPRLETLRRGLAPRLGDAVTKALAPEPSDRFATVADFVRAFEDSVGTPQGALPGQRWRLVAGAALLGGLALAAALLRRTTAVATKPGPVRIAVVPFRETGDAIRPGFATGVAEALRSDLATLPNVDVVAATSVQALGDSARRPRYVAEQLGATHVLTGTLQWVSDSAGARVRIVPELVAVQRGVEQATTGEAITERIEDLFRSQGRISSQIAAGLGVPASAEASQRLRRSPTTNRLAYESWLRSTLDVENRREHLQRAVALDSNFARAWASLGIDAGLSFQDALDPALATLARDASARALLLDSTLGTSHLARALYERHVTRNFAAAVAHGRAAMKHAPGNASMMHFTAAALWSAGRLDEALALARRAANLDPRNPSALARVATLLIWQRTFPDAEAATQRALAASARAEPFINADSVLLPLARGDLVAARRFLASLDSTTGPTMGFLMREWNLAWVADSSLFALGAPTLRGSGALYAYYTAQAQRAALARDARRQAAFADSAIRATTERLARLPSEERLRISLAFALAIAGRREEALAQADSVSRTRSAWHDAFQGAPLSLSIAEVRAIAGDRAHAVALADSLLAVPGFVTPAYLRIDPWLRDSYMVTTSAPRARRDSR